MKVWGNVCACRESAFLAPLKLSLPAAATSVKVSNLTTIYAESSVDNSIALKAILNRQ
jgi:hypothetical protein